MKSSSPIVGSLSLITFRAVHPKPVPGPWRTWRPSCKKWRRVTKPSWTYMLRRRKVQWIGRSWTEHNSINWITNVVAANLFRSRAHSCAATVLVPAPCIILTPRFNLYSTTLLYDYHCMGLFMVGVVWGLYIYI